MREIVLDTETTGLDPAEGHRIIEIGCIEILHTIPTGQIFHVYIDPQRDIPEDAVRVHGITAEFLAGKPVFADIASEFLAFIGDAKLVAHNAAFDMRFLNAELGLLGLEPIDSERVVDTLALARRRHPGASNSLDALCNRYGIDNTRRTKHGALLDSEILADVYAELLGGAKPLSPLKPLPRSGRTIHIRPHSGNAPFRSKALFPHRSETPIEPSLPNWATKPSGSPTCLSLKIPSPEDRMQEGVFHRCCLLQHCFGNEDNELLTISLA